MPQSLRRTLSAPTIMVALLPLQEWVSFWGFEPWTAREPARPTLHSSSTSRLIRLRHKCHSQKASLALPQGVWCTLSTPTISHSITRLGRQGALNQGSSSSTGLPTSNGLHWCLLIYQGGGVCLVLTMESIARILTKERRGQKGSLHRFPSSLPV